MKIIYILDLSRVNFCISKLFSQCNTGSCCMQIASGVNVYSCVVCVSVNWSLCVMCLFFCVSDQNTTSKNYMPFVSSLNLMPCCIKHRKVLLVLKLVLRLDKFKSIIILSNNTLDVVWSHVQPKSKGNKKTWGVEQILKKVSKQCKGFFLK